MLVLFAVDGQARNYRADFDGYKRPKQLTLQFGPIIQDVRTTTARVVWGTFKGGKCLVRYAAKGAEGGAESEVVAVSQDPRKAEDHWTKTFYEDALIHEAEITGLKPNTAYRYYVVTEGKDGKKVQSPECSFRTAPPAGSRKPFTFVLYGDTREKKRVTYHYELVNAVLKAYPKEYPALVLVSGDNCNDSEMFRGWLYEFLVPGKKLYANVPAYLAVGNHDIHPIDAEKKSETITPGLQRALFTPPHGNLDYFSFVYDNVKFIVVDTQLRDLSPGAPQRKWLAEQCRRTAETDWLIVMGHHPAISSNKRYRQGSDTLPALLEEKNVDMYLCGHNHHYERLVKNGIPYVVSGGGGAQLYGFKEPFHESSVARVRAHHYCEFKVNGRKCEVVVRNTENKVIDSFAAERPEDPKGKVILKKLK